MSVPVERVLTTSFSRLPYPLRSPFVWRTVARWALPIWFSLFSIQVVLYTWTGGNLGGDARVYALAARAWLDGGDPWHAGLLWSSGIQHWMVYYASLPPTLLFFVPFAYLPDWAVAAAWMALDLVLMGLVVRRLQMPRWWILWPPFIAAVAVGNPEPVALGLLVLLGGRLGALAPLVKICTIAPLLAERRWGLVAMSIALLAVTALILPWRVFVGDATWFSQAYVSQTGAGQSSTAFPILVPLVIVALASFGWRRAGWLLVPALWPNAHIHYAVTALPVMTPVIAWVSLLPMPGAFAIGVIAEAIFEFARFCVHRIQSERA